MAKCRVRGLHMHVLLVCGHSRVVGTTRRQHQYYCLACRQKRLVRLFFGCNVMDEARHMLEKREEGGE